MSLRDEETKSIRAFLEAAGNAGLFRGRVLDYGCGQQPYRALVKSFGAEYVGYDRKEFPANVSIEDVGEENVEWDDWDTVLCTQVLQYVERPIELLSWFQHILKEKSGHLVMTYPTHWPEVEREDLHRFTQAGMERLLKDAGFDVLGHVRRHATYLLNGEALVHGYGVTARA